MVENLASLIIIAVIAAIIILPIRGITRVISDELARRKLPRVTEYQARVNAAPLTHAIIERGPAPWPIPRDGRTPPKHPTAP